MIFYDAQMTVKHPALDLAPIEVAYGNRTINGVAGIWPDGTRDFSTLDEEHIRAKHGSSEVVRVAAMDIKPYRIGVDEGAAERQAEILKLGKAFSGIYRFTPNCEELARVSFEQPTRINEMAGKVHADWLAYKPVFDAARFVFPSLYYIETLSRKAVSDYRRWAIVRAAVKFAARYCDVYAQGKGRIYFVAADYRIIADDRPNSVPVPRDALAWVLEALHEFEPTAAVALWSPPQYPITDYNAGIIRAFSR